MQTKSRAAEMRLAPGDHARARPRWRSRGLRGGHQRPALLRRIESICAANVALEVAEAAFADISPVAFSSISQKPWPTSAQCPG